VLQHSCVCLVWVVWVILVYMGERGEAKLRRCWGVDWVGDVIRPD